MVLISIERLPLWESMQELMLHCPCVLHLVCRELYCEIEVSLSESNKRPHNNAFDMILLQSSVCVKQFTYSVLELLITTTFPELQALVHNVGTSGVTT
jgi:hypothetical protein